MLLDLAFLLFLTNRLFFSIFIFSNNYIKVYKYKNVKENRIIYKFLQIDNM